VIFSGKAWLTFCCPSRSMSKPKEEKYIWTFEVRQGVLLRIYHEKATSLRKSTTKSSRKVVTQ
jgi:hypothetical protein